MGGPMFHSDHADGARPLIGRRGLIAGGGGLVLAGSTLGAAAGTAAATSRTIGDPVPADVYAAICQLKTNYVTATDSLPFPGTEDRALALYRATYTDGAESSAGYDAASPDFLVHGPDELFDTLRSGLSTFSSSQHNVGVIHVELSDARPRRQVATITAHVLVTLVTRATSDLTRIAATYHDEAEKRNGRWRVTKSFAQYLATETATRLLPPPAP